MFNKNASQLLLLFEITHLKFENIYNCGKNI